MNLDIHGPNYESDYWFLIFFKYDAFLKQIDINIQNIYIKIYKIFIYKCTKYLYINIQNIYINLPK